MESKPVISYAGDEVLFSSLQQGVTQQLPVDHVEWRRSFGRAAKPVYIEASFVKFTESCLHKEHDWRLIGETFFHTYWTDCVDVDQYKSTVKEDITNWLTILKNHGVNDWLVVVVETMDGRKGNKAKLLPRASVIDKIKHDFCNKQQERCISLLDPLKSDSRGAESWQSLLICIRQLLLQAYNRHLGKFEEHMRSQRERRNEPGWSFCEYFILQEELAFVFEMLGVYDEALVQYDELDALFTQFVLNSKVGDTPEWLRNFYRTCDSWLGLTLIKHHNAKKQLLIRDGKASLLDIRNYLFSRQCSLLLLLYRPWEVAQRTLPFLHNCINELQILEVSLPPGAVSCWVFLSCLEILQTCEKFHDSTQVEAYSLYTAGLWAYACDKLRELGELCGLMPGMKETSEQLHLVVGLLSGLVEVDLLPDKNSTTPITKLKEAMSSRDAFRHRYNEMSELAMGTFKHIGRFRSARLIGRDLALFHMKLGEHTKAAAFLADLVKNCLLENWTILAANIRLDLAKCYHELKDHDKYIKVCTQLAASPCLDEQIRLNHFEQMLSYSNAFIGDNRSVRVWASDIFSIESITVDCESQMIIRDSCIMITVVLNSNLIRDLNCNDIVIAVVSENDSKRAQSTKRLSGSESRWKSWNQTSDVQLSEQFDFQQDRSLTCVSLVCPNVQTVLRRRDSQYGLHREKEISNDDHNERLVYGEVVLRPGKNILVYKRKARDSGYYNLSKIVIKANHFEFVIPSFQPTVGYEVVNQQPKLYFQKVNKGDLIAGAEQELVLIIQTGSCLVENGMVVKLKGSDGLLLRIKNESYTESPYLQSVECAVPVVQPFDTISIKVNVLSETEICKDSSSFERKVTIVNPWTQEENQAVLLFVAPFSTIYKLHTTNNRKYVQITVQGLQSVPFEISNHQLTSNCPEIALVPSNPSTRKLVVCKHQNISYVWEMVSNLLEYPPLHLVLQINYQHKPENGVAVAQQPCTYKYRFHLENYKTLYTVQSKVEPFGAEFCRVGSICHMNVTINIANSATAISSLPSLMYEVIADQISWAICGRSAGIVSLGVEGSHSTTLDVMPLTRGFLPLPSVRVSKYVAMDQKGNKLDTSIVGSSQSYGSSYPRLEPFSPGQIYNWSKAEQVHVLPALGTASTDSLTS